MPTNVRIDLSEDAFWEREALLDPALADLAVDVVLGLHPPHRQSVLELVARRPNTTLHGPLPSLAGLIARADLAIGAGGAIAVHRQR